MNLMTNESKSSINLYFPVYRSIESEVIELSKGIYFSDEQLKVYSIKISELLSRCLTEIESLYKDLYRRLNNSNPENIGDAWRFLDEEWKLSTKQLAVTSDNFFFDKSFRPYFSPFDYVNGSPDDFYSAYNAIKHDRAKNLPKANLNVLIRALGALYILNIYYKDEPLPSAAFTPRKADRAIGIFLDIGLDLNDTLSSSLYIEYVPYDYMFWQDDHLEVFQQMVRKLTKPNVEVLIDYLNEPYPNLLAASNKLFSLEDPKISIGDTLRKTFDIFEKVATCDVDNIINKGYNKVYMNFDERQQKMSDVFNGRKIISYDQLYKDR